MRIGIFFGGPAREREISFMGGRTAYDNLDRSLFEPVLIFVSGWGRFYKVAPDFLRHESIRDAFPTVDGFAVYDESLDPDDALPTAEPIEPEWFEEYFDVALLALHGPDCEDGAIQGLLEWHKMPYTGTGIVGSAVGINKTLQNDLIALVNGQQKKTATITRDAWQTTDQAQFFASLVAHLGLPVVVKAPHQGSSIGVAIVREQDLSQFQAAVAQCFFTLRIDLADWRQRTDADRRAFAQRIANLDEGIGYPVVIEETGAYATGPVELLALLHNVVNDSPNGVATPFVTLASVNAEDEVLFEEFIRGQEFSCGVIQDDNGAAVALPPTEIYNAEAFDFQTKYKTNVAKKRIPVETSLENNRKIQLAVAEVFTKLGINVYARIDGFLTAAGKVLLHDPNTIPGMSPASLIFKQMAEIGLNITQSLTYLIRQSLRERIRTGKDTYRLKQMLADLDARLAGQQANPKPEQRIHFGPTDEDLARAKAEYNRVAAEGTHRPVLVYLKSKVESHEVPTHLLFRETVADLEAGLRDPRHPLLAETAELAKAIAGRYT